MSLTNTPRANRLHIGIYGRRNTGKSSLINALTRQNTAIVSDVAGTTADPVYKAMEVNGLGPCVFIDTAGFDDEGTLGEMRVEKTKQAVDKTDIALVIFTGTKFDLETEWINLLKSHKTPIIPIINKADLLSDIPALSTAISKLCQQQPLIVSALTGEGIHNIRQAIIRSLPPDDADRPITAGIVCPGSHVLLVMPQDIQAPKGRLILPQVQTIRELLDKKCVITSTTTGQLEATLSNMVREPDVIITDSQIFKEVYAKKPASSKLTSFSVLFAGSKGDISYYAASASAIDRLTRKSRVLIAEACTHAPLSEDIGTVKIPRLLQQRIGPELSIEHVSGTDFPEDLTGYDLIIQCGGCMFNRKYILSRIERARSQGIPMTNYGIAIAFMNGILDNISYE